MLKKQPEVKGPDPRQATVHLDERGREVVSNVPIAPPIGYKRSPSLSDQIRQALHASRAELAASGHESFEEGDDFEVGDDFDPSSPYEIHFEPEESEEKYGKPVAGKWQWIPEEPTDGSNLPSPGRTPLEGGEPGSPPPPKKA